MTFSLIDEVAIRPLARKRPQLSTGLSEGGTELRFEVALLSLLACSAPGTRVAPMQRVTRDDGASSRHDKRKEKRQPR